MGILLHDALANPTIMAVHAQADAADAESDAARAGYIGSARVSYARHAYDDSRVVGYYAPGTQPPPLLSKTVDNAILTYELPIDLFGQIAADVDRSSSNASAAHLNLRHEQLAKLNQTVGAYVTLYTLERRREAMVAYRQWADAAVQRLQTEVKLKRAAPVEARYAESQVAGLRSDETQLDGDVAAAQALLAEATGHGGFLPRARIVPIPPWREIPADQALPVQLARAKDASTQAAARLARANLLPRLALDSAYAYNAAPPGDHRNTWSIGVTLSVPLSLSRAKLADAAAANAIAARQSTRATLQQTTSTITALHAQYAAALDEVITLQKEVDYRASVVTVERKMQVLGSQTLENAFRHEDDLLEARTRLAQARAKAVVAWSQMQIVIGIDPADYIAALDPSAVKP